MQSLEELEGQIRNVPGFPIEGVVFKDITTLLTSPGSIADMVMHMEKACEGWEYDAVAAIESRGFVFGAVIAARAGLPLVLVRKPGKLPAETISREYTLEYGTSRVEMHRNSLPRGSRVLIVDDLVATGGSALAAAELVITDGCSVAGAVFAVDLKFLGGSGRLRDSGIACVGLIEVSTE